VGRRRLEPEARRQAILEAAVLAFDDAGPEQVSLEAVAERAGVSRALVYTYFTNRQRLVRAVFSEIVRDLADELRLALEGAETPEQRMTAWIATLVRYARVRPNRWHVVRWTVLSQDPEAADGLAELLRSFGFFDGHGDGSGQPLVLTALAGMVDWTAERLDDRGASELARLAWGGTSGVVDRALPGGHDGSPPAP
jgi:AcrR family transcriptional regulator